MRKDFILLYKDIVGSVCNGKNYGTKVKKSKIVLRKTLRKIVVVEILRSALDLGVD